MKSKNSGGYGEAEGRASGGELVGERLLETGATLREEGLFLQTGCWSNDERAADAEKHHG